MWVADFQSHSIKVNQVGFIVIYVVWLSLILSDHLPLVALFCCAQAKGEICRKVSATKMEIYECPKMFYSPNKRYCCGSTTLTPYCCTLEERSQEEDFHFQPYNLRMLSGKITYFVLFVLLVILVMLMLCCVAARRADKQASRFEMFGFQDTNRYSSIMQHSPCTTLTGRASAPQDPSFCGDEPPPSYFSLYEGETSVAVVASSGEGTSVIPVASVPVQQQSASAPLMTQEAPIESNTSSTPIKSETSVTMNGDGSSKVTTKLN